MTKMRHVLMISSLLFSALALGACSSGARATDGGASPDTAFRNNKRVVLAPPNQGVYLGAFEAKRGAIYTVEQLIGRKVVFSPFLGLGPAERAARGYVSATGPIEATPYDSLPGFTVDRLLKGDYDEVLADYAELHRNIEHGKTLLFETMREPNAVLSRWMGGFGPAGDKGRTWAEDNGRLDDAFDVSQFPTGHLANPHLYAGLGDDQLCDGLERAVAAQRYFYDFFVDRQGLGAITFGTMGWAVVMEAQSAAAAHCYDATLFFRLLRGYYDWISLNWYMAMDGPVEPTNQEYTQALDSLMKEIQDVDPDSPVMLSELGFCNDNRPGKVTVGMTHILRRHPRIGAIALWTSNNWAKIDCRLPASSGGRELKQIIDAHPQSFHSCPVYSDGSSLPGCAASPRSDIPRPGAAPL